MPAAARTASPPSQGIATGFDDVKMPQYTPPTTRFSEMVEDLQPRVMRNREAWTLFYFDDHARACSHCHNPLEVHRRHGRLCRDGVRLAEDVARLIFSKDNAAVVYYHPDLQAQQLVRVRLPQEYTEVLSLLRAFERSLRKLNNQTPIISYDRIYFVPVRPLLGPASTRTRRPLSPPRASQPRRTGTYRQSGVFSPLPEEEITPAASLPRSPLRATNYQAPSVEDDGAPAAPSPTSEGQTQSRPQAQAQRRPQPQPQPQSSRSGTTTEAPSSPTPTAQPFQTRQRQPPAPITTNTASPTSTASTSQLPPAPQSPRRQRPTPSTTTPPEAPEPPQRSQREPPTDFSYNTVVREPPTPQPRQPRANRPTRRRHSGFWPFQ